MSDLLKLAAPGLAHLQTYRPGKSVEAVRAELGLTRVIKLASNENPLGPSPKVAQALAAGLDLARYPDGSGAALKRALADFHGLEPACFTLGNGSNDVLELAARSVVSPGHEVIYSEHAFIVYHLATHAIGATPVVTPRRNHGHDLEAMADAITPRTRLIFIDNPNNPTGSWVDKKHLQAFLSTVPDDVLVVVDEAYYDYAASLYTDYPDATHYLSERPNLVVTRSFSKAYGLAGLRVGYAVSHPDLADLMNRVRQPFNVNAMALVAAQTALQDQTHLQRCVRLNKQEMQTLGSAFTRLGLQWLESAGNFLCFKPSLPAAETCAGLLRQGIVVRAISEYGLPDHLRVSIGLEAENIEFLKALQELG